MKGKIFAVIACAAVLVGASGCSMLTFKFGDNNGGNTSAASQTAGSSRYASVRDYIKSDEFQEMLKEEKKKYDTEDMSVNIDMEGDTALVYDVKMKKKLSSAQKDALRKKLSVTLSNSQYTKAFHDLLTKIHEASGDDSVYILLRYSNKDGSVILEKKYSQTTIR